MGFFTDAPENYLNMYSLLNVIFYYLFSELVDAPRDSIFEKGQFFVRSPCADHLKDLNKMNDSTELLSSTSHRPLPTVVALSAGAFAGFYFHPL